MNQTLKEYQVNFIEKKSQDFDKAFWEEANCLTDFCSPWNQSEISKIELRVLYDLENLYFKFTVFDPDIYIDVKDESFESIGNSDRVELFFRTNRELNPYYCLEIDSNARIMDFRAYPNKNFDFEWKWPKENLTVKASRSKTYFTVEGQISIKSLKALDLIQENRLEVGVFRVKFNKIYNSEYEPTWCTWVNPETKSPNFHIASSFGRFVLMK